MSNMISDINDLLDDYCHWLKNNTAIKEIDSEWIEVTTPFLDRHNDNYQIYISKNNDGYTMTDDGYVISDLRMSGCDMSTGKRKEWLNTVINSYGIMLDGDSLNVHATEMDFSAKKHDLIQAMQSLDGLFYTSKTTVKGLFFEDVSEWLCNSAIPHASNLTLEGANFTYHIDFILSEKKTHDPRRILQVMNSVRKSEVANLVMMKEDFDDDIEINVMINDLNSKQEQINALCSSINNFGMKPILWSKRESLKEVLM